MAKRRDLLKWMPLGATALPMALFGAGPGKLPSAVVSAKNAKVTHESFGDLRVFFEGPTDQLKMMTAGSLMLKPGMTPHPPHKHEEEEFMVVTEGTGEISMDGKITPVGPGGMMYSAAHRLHGIVNTGKVPLLFYYYKWKA